METIANIGDNKIYTVNKYGDIAVYITCGIHTTTLEYTQLV